MKFFLNPLCMKEPQKDTLLSWEQNFHRGPRYWFREMPDGVVTRSMVWIGVVLAVCGAALFVYAATHVPPNSRAPWVPQIVGGGFVVAGVVWVIARHTFELNWSNRTWRQTHRFLIWTTSDRQGSFDDLAALVLSEHRRPVLSRPSRFWVIGIRFRNVPTLIDLFLFFNQQRARAKLLYLVQKMEIPAIDQSQG